MSRDEFSTGIKEELAKRVAYLCSNPACKQSTSGPQTASRGTVNIGVAAHITAASPNGPRYDKSLSETERCSAGNGIWLCQSCAKLIDSDQPGFTVDKLFEWKIYAEASAAKALEYRQAPVTESEGIFLEAERRMPDLIKEMQEDVQGDKTRLIYELVVLPNRNVVFGHNKPRFVYYEDEHPQAKLQIDWLEDMGLIRDVTPGNWPIYRMLQEFHEWLYHPC